MQATAVVETAATRSAAPNRSPNEIRRHVHRAWGSVAEAWAQYADYADARGAAVTARMLDLTSPRPGERVLELACGPGGVGLAAARLVTPGGQVVLSDVAPEMTAVAALRAATLGLANVRTRPLDLEDIRQPDGSYDIALCREGLMFAVDPAHAVQEIWRVLRPGGRTAIAVWGPSRRNPWLGLVFEAVSAALGAPVPPPGIPGPFSLDDPARLHQLLDDSGFGDVVVEELPTPLRDDSFDDWWTRTTALAGPVAGRIAALPTDSSRALRERLERAVEPYRTAHGLEFPGLTLLASGRRA